MRWLSLLIILSLGGCKPSDSASAAPDSTPNSTPAPPPKTPEPPPPVKAPKPKNAIAWLGIPSGVERTAKRRGRRWAAALDDTPVKLAAGYPKVMKMADLGLDGEGYVSVMGVCPESSPDVALLELAALPHSGSPRKVAWPADVAACPTWKSSWAKNPPLTTDDKRLRGHFGLDPDLSTPSEVAAAQEVGPWAAWVELLDGDRVINRQVITYATSAKLAKAGRCDTLVLLPNGPHFEMDVKCYTTGRCDPPGLVEGKIIFSVKNDTIDLRFEEKSRRPPCGGTP